MTADHTITATFAPNVVNHTITASAGANGSITPSGAVSVNHGTDQSFTIIPDAHYHLVDVKVDNVSQGAISSYTFGGVTADHTIAATFAIDQVTLSVNMVGQGAVTKVPIRPPTTTAARCT